jgi:hypothetical protein
MSFTTTGILAGGGNEEAATTSPAMVRSCSSGSVCQERTSGRPWVIRWSSTSQVYQSDPRES